MILQKSKYWKQLNISELPARKEATFEKILKYLEKNEFEVDKELFKVLLKQLEESKKIVNHWGKDEDSFNIRL